MNEFIRWVFVVVGTGFSLLGVGVIVRMGFAVYEGKLSPFNFFILSVFCLALAGFGLWSADSAYHEGTGDDSDLDRH